MTVSIIQVSEYTCERCGYKWINRVNGVDGPLPQRCAKCKKRNWNRNRISHREIGLRRRVKSFETIYFNQALYWWRDNTISWPNGLTERFLNLHPSPTVKELEQVVYNPPEGYAIRINSQNQYTRRGWIRHPNKPGKLKYDEEGYKRLLKQGIQKRCEIMEAIIDSRLRIGIGSG